MTDLRKLVCAGIAVAALVLPLGMVAAPAAHANGTRDRLFVGDGVGNNVEVFGAVIGAHLRTLPTATAPVVGPRGILYAADRLLLVNQNVGQPLNGEVLRFAAGTGDELAPVPGSSPDAPFAPRGMIRWKGHLFVANVCNPCAPPDTGGGSVFKYTMAGKFIEALTPPAGPTEFHPFGVVVGPDGFLYVSSRPSLFSSGLGGQVLQFDPETGDFIKEFISSSGGGNRLNGPEGLVFGPDGRLYITSFRGSDQDTDKILIFDGPRSAHPGRRVGKIDLDQAGGARATAQTLLFGPGGDLFVPISNVEIADPTDDQGAIRRYRIGCTPTATRKCFTYFVCPSAGEPGMCPPGKLGQGWYLTFGKTRPGTLAYGG